MSVQQRVVQFGLTEVFCPPEPLVDIVFVHGLNGHPYNTWATHTPAEVFWPSDLLPSALQDQHCRILTYGYDAQVTAFSDGASKDKLHNHAEHLASRLVANRSLKKALERPIIFVCHSLGGLVVKRCLVHSKNVRHANIERQRSIFVSTYGILFLGTPHNGSDIAKWGSLLERISHAVLPKKFIDSQPHLVQALKSNNETLQNINRLFIEIIGRYHVYFFHESKPMDFKGTMQYIVDEDSAAPVIEGVERMGIERDHSHMCKFESEDAPGYDVVAEAIQRYAEDASGLIKTRWEEERRIRELEKREAARELLRDSPSAIDSLTLAESAQISQTSSLGNSMVVSESSLHQPERYNGADRPRIVTPLGFRPNIHFIGFQHELRRLHRRLQHEKRREMGSCAVLLWGEVGSGKTHLARQYFYEHRNHYPEGSFWVDCKTKESITKGLWDIGIGIGALEHDPGKGKVPPSPDNFADAVRTRLESMQGWLMVFDGILFETEDSLNEFRRYVPDRAGNCIIFTSVDRTLTHRHRLLYPSALKIGKLSISDATDLLYQNLGIRHPTTTQQEKALELVKDNDYLPLAIYATAHALIERGKTLERYSHTTADERLIRPFLEIITGLQDQGRIEAVNLVKLLSFFTHQIPVALIRFGYRGLFTSEYAVPILSPKYANSTRSDLDSSISILLRSGLLERTLQTWTRTSGSSSPEETRSMKSALGERQSIQIGQNMTRDTSSPEKSKSAKIAAPSTHRELSHGTAKDMKRSIMIRTIENTPPANLVEESSGLDDLMITRLESRGTRASTVSTQSVVDTLRIHTIVQNVIRDDLREKPLMGEHDYWWWLGGAVRLLVCSYATASEKMRLSSGAGLVRDYREYESQAARLLHHFPRTSLNASAELRRARHDARSLLKMVKREIQTQSPSNSSDISTFKEYHGSVFEGSSSTSEETQSFTTLSPASTWSLDPDHPTSESPTQMYHPHSSWEDPLAELAIGNGEDAIYSDTDTWPMSDTTDVPVQRSRRSSVLYAVLEGKPRLKQYKDLGDFHEWKAPLVRPAISHPEIAFEQSSRTTSESRSSRPSSSSEAEAALALMHRSGPPASRRGGRLRSTSRGSSERPPLSIRSPNTSMPAVAATFQQNDSASLTRPAPRNLSSSPRLVQALLNSQAGVRTTVDPQYLPIEKVGRVDPSTQIHRPPLSTQHPRVSSPGGIQASHPSGYQSLPMSRDTSRESNATELASRQFDTDSGPNRAFSDPHIPGFNASPNDSFNTQDQIHRRPPQSLEFVRVGECANISPSQPPFLEQAFESMSFPAAGAHGSASGL